MEQIGFIGLGIMGLPMAKRLLEAGYQLLVNDVSQERVEILTRLGARSAACSQIGQECGLVFTILPNGSIVQQVLFAPDGVA